MWHEVPDGYKHLHDKTPHCWCNPFIDPEGVDGDYEEGELGPQPVVMHHNLGLAEYGREDVEYEMFRGKRLPPIAEA